MRTIWTTVNLMPVETGRKSDRPRLADSLSHTQKISIKWLQVVRNICTSKNRCYRAHCLTGLLPVIFCAASIPATIPMQSQCNPNHIPQTLSQATKASIVLILVNMNGLFWIFALSASNPHQFSRIEIWMWLSLKLYSTAAHPGYICWHAPWPGFGEWKFLERTFSQRALFLLSHRRASQDVPGNILPVNSLCCAYWKTLYRDLLSSKEYK